MKVIDLDDLVEQEATIIIKKEEYVLNEVNGYKWAEFNNRIEDLDQENVEKVMEFQEFMINSVIPGLDVKILTQTEYAVVSSMCNTVFNGGICEIGKKLKPLEQIIKIIKK